MDRLVAETWPHVAALAEMLDELDGRRVQINHTIEHVERRGGDFRDEPKPLDRHAKHREQQYVVGL